MPAGASGCGVAAGRRARRAVVAGTEDEALRRACQRAHDVRVPLRALALSAAHPMRRLCWAILSLQQRQQGTLLLCEQAHALVSVVSCGRAILARCVLCMPVSMSPCGSSTDITACCKRAHPPTWGPSRVQAPWPLPSKRPIYRAWQLQRDEDSSSEVGPAHAERLPVQAQHRGGQQLRGRLRGGRLGRARARAAALALTRQRAPRHDPRGLHRVHLPAAEARSVQRRRASPARAGR